MSTLVTFPGRSGDLLWALPSVRALAEQEGAPVDFLVSSKYGSLQPLIEQQSYIRHCMIGYTWDVQETAPMTPRIPAQFIGIVNGDSCDLLDPVVGAYDRVIHLGYDGWPAAPLPYDIANRAGVAIDLRRPWITSPGWPQVRADITIGFTDEWFELKYGIVKLLEEKWPAYEADPCQTILLPAGSRWATETENYMGPTTWEQAAKWISTSQVFFGCCSALHVLAVALGIPCVIMEPAEARWNPVFWPLGTAGPEVTLVRGGDGKPTHDARHCAEALSARLGLAEKEER